MIYTENNTIAFPIIDKNGIMNEQVVPAQMVFDCCVHWIKQNTSETNLHVKNLLKINPILASMKNSASEGNSLLIYATSSGNEEITKAILDLHVDINATNDTKKQTALHQAVIANHYSVIDLLISAGANVNSQDYKKQTALYIAAAKGQLDIVKKITALKEINLELENLANWSPLHAATVAGHLQIVEHLIDVGACINRSGPESNTALHCAIKENKLEIAKCLIMKGADVSLSDDHNQSPLLLAVLAKNIELVQLILSKGGDPYHTNVTDTVLERSLDSNDPALFAALWHKEHTKALCECILNNDKDKVTKLLKNFHYTEHDLQVFFLFCVNQRKFTIASLLFEPLQNHSKFGNLRSPEQDIKEDQERSFAKETFLKEAYSYYKDIFKKQLILEKTNYESRSEAILDAFAQMATLLSDTQTCIELLQVIDQELANILPELSNIAPQDNFIIRELLWPDAAPDNYQPLNKKGVLRELLRKHLQQYHIEEQEELYDFAGFVKTKVANAVVSKAALFKEQFLLNNALAHGLFSHYFQWFIFIEACKRNIIILQGGLLPKDILLASIDIKITKHIGAWGRIIDYVSSSIYADNRDNLRLYPKPFMNFFHSTPLRYNFSSVLELSSFLYTSPKLPHIRGYLLDSLYKKVEKIQFMVEKKFPTEEKINHKHMIAGQAIGFWAFNRFKNGLSVNDVTEYYRHYSKTKGSFDEETGIVTKGLKPD